MKNRLIVCCDGTWQDLSKGYPTNVVKIAQAIKPIDDVENIPQIVYYDEGIGAKQINNIESNAIDTWMQAAGKAIDLPIQFLGGAFGLGIDYKILDAYHFLCLNYQPEDEIYLFGFSRGAYTVRSLAGLIYNSGLLKRENIRQIPKAYEIYRDRLNEHKKPQGKTAREFRQEYAHGSPDKYQVPIKALCCWDTVASLGIPDLISSLPLDEIINEGHSFHDHKVNSMVENAFHAVAIDENRHVFDVTLMEPSQNVTQVWFPGTHGDVGGGSSERGLSDGALDWMMEQVERLGLSLDRGLVTHPINGTIVRGVSPNYMAPMNDTSSLLWKILSPLSWNILGNPGREITTDNFADLHESVKKRWQDNPNYRPENLEKFTTQLNYSSKSQLPMPVK
ncbi:DUF2235 domain-containing protein [Crocosphaera sp.]|uniref:DUF2235 domain-containing protein n=1 Tax=Crocosphaera sp. TaxID=2729996 RepID=UPI00260801BA|nr:DUF2235 domain-containing protein [Crocosphaera sp.]MDJ0578980.1 DUF2235 domain-containing protein [Crocosphaera sp.]